MFAWKSMNSAVDGSRSQYELLRCPERRPKCYEMTDQERKAALETVNDIPWDHYSDLPSPKYYENN
jgi:hypothetical protein